MKKIVLSGFDGIACGMIGLKRAGITPDIYLASEINEDAIGIAMYHFPDIVQLGTIEKIKIQTIYLSEAYNYLCKKYFNGNIQSLQSIISEREMLHRINKKETFSAYWGTQEQRKIGKTQSNTSFGKIQWEILRDCMTLSEAETEERSQILLMSGNCVNILSGGMGTDNTNPELRRRVSKGLMGRAVTEKSKEKIRKTLNEYFSTPDTREHQRIKALEQFQDPIKKQNYLDAISKLDRAAMGMKKRKTAEIKRQEMFLILKNNYKPHMSMRELSILTEISATFIRKHKSLWLNVNGD
jgi:hypothetical protein